MPQLADASKLSVLSAIQHPFLEVSTPEYSQNIGSWEEIVWRQSDIHPHNRLVEWTELHFLQTVTQTDTWTFAHWTVCAFIYNNSSNCC